MAKRRRILAATLALTAGSVVGGTAVDGTAVAAPAAAAHRAPAPPDVVAAPVQTAATSAGPVGYREVGSGPPLVLIMGLAGTMEAWDPGFVDALARHHRVVIFDNAGVGATAPVEPLTISGMADQTSALITALHLGRVDVLGWSMGGMTAQALAVRHPGQVDHLVLAATQPGTGASLPVPPAAAAAAASGNPEEVLSVLFPADQTAAAERYGQAVESYGSPISAPAAVVAQQSGAIGAWLAGQDPAGPPTAHLHNLTLVADGSEDALDPVANDVTLTRTIHPSLLAVYPDAGHAFLFQDQAVFAPTVAAFLALP